LSQTKKRGGGNCYISDSTKGSKCSRLWANGYGKGEKGFLSSKILGRTGEKQGSGGEGEEGQTFLSTAEEKVGGQEDQFETRGRVEKRRGLIYSRRMIGSREGGGGTREKFEKLYPHKLFIGERMIQTVQDDGGETLSGRVGHKLCMTFKLGERNYMWYEGDNAEKKKKA